MQFRICLPISFTMTSTLSLVLCILLLLISLIFATPPKLIPLLSHFDLEENISFPLMCGLLKGDGQITFQWIANGVQLENNSHYRIDASSPRSSLLTISNVRRENSGQYECRAVNSFGEADVTKTRINVQGKKCACMECVFEI